MSGQRDMDRFVTDWLRADAPPSAPPRVLAAALDRVADVGQEGSLGTRLGGWAGGSASLRWGIVIVVLGAALLGAVIGAGAILLREALVIPPTVSNGWVAFTVEGVTRQSESDIWVVRDGIEERRLTGSDTDSMREVCPRFSPDGARLAYVERPADYVDDSEVAVVIVAADGAGRLVGPDVRLLIEAWGGVCPVWSPDSRSVAFLAFESTGSGPLDPGVPSLWVGGVDGSTRRIGAWGETNTVVAIDWSPDAASIVATEITGSRVWIVPMDGSQARLFQTAGPGVELTRGPEYEGARWSPDGTRIALVAYRYAGDPDSGGILEGSSIQIHRLDGKDAPVELDGGGPFAWSPDGRWIAYVRPGEQDGSEVGEIVAATTTGDDPHVIASERRWVRGLTWAPDASQVLYVADAPGALVSVSVTGDTPPVVLTHRSHSFEWTESEDISWQVGSR